MIWLYIRVLLVYLEIWISPVTCAVDSSCSTSQMLSNWCPTILLIRHYLAGSDELQAWH